MLSSRDKQGRRVSWQRIVLTLVGFFAVFTALAWLGIFITRRIIFVSTVQDMAKSAATRPRLATLTDISTVPVTRSTQLEAFGWEFAVPNASVKSHHEFQTTDTLNFEDGSSLLVVNQYDLNTIWKTWLPVWSSTGAFHTSELKNPYEFQRAALLENYSVRSHLWQTHLLLRQFGLATQSMLHPSDAVAVYDVAAGTARGFEFVLRNKTGTHFVVDLYDGNDDSIQLIYHPTQEKPQAQLNTLLASVRPPA
jgi:hypothetical protein